VNTSDLTDAMKSALREVAYGVRKYRRGYYSIEDPTVRVNTRSLDALYRRGLIAWGSRGGAPQIIEVVLTAEGERLFESLEKEIVRRVR